MDPYPNQGSSIFEEEAPPVYASFWERFGACIIDALILAVPHYIINRILGQERYDGFFVRTTSFGFTTSDWNFVNTIFDWLYFALQESGPARATLGKRALGLTVIGESGGRLSFMQATGRYFGKIVSALILMIGFLMVFWDSKRQALHDKMAGTLVVK